MSAQIEMFQIATGLKPGNQVLIPREMLVDAVIAERKPDIINIFSRSVDRDEVELFLQKVSRNWDFKHTWENHFETGRDWLVMYKDPIPAHYEIVPNVEHTMALCTGCLPHEEYVTQILVKESPITRCFYRYQPRHKL